METKPIIHDLAIFVLKQNNITSPLKKIDNVSAQVVSGKNYKFDLSLEDGIHYRTQIYVNSKGNKQIIDFQKLS